MYRSESAFKQSLLKALRDRGCLCVCIESHETSRGIPDIYVLGKGKGCDGWIELKNMKDGAWEPKKGQWKIDWRSGQQVWAYEYYVRMNKDKCTLTVAALSEGYIIIPMTSVREDGYVKEDEVLKCKTMEVLVGNVIEWLEEMY